MILLYNWSLELEAYLVLEMHHFRYTIHVPCGQRLNLALTTSRFPD